MTFLAILSLVHCKEVLGSYTLLSIAGLTSVFTCGGHIWHGGAGHSIVDSEVTDLPSLEVSHSDRTCHKVPKLPSGKRYHFAMWDEGDKSVLCCGGEPSLQHKRCYKYAGDEWIDVGEILKNQRHHSTAVKLSDGRYWISGGYRYELQNLSVVLQLPRAK